MTTKAVEKAFTVPHTYMIILGLCGIALALTWLMPADEYERYKNQAGVTVVDPDSYRVVASRPVRPTRIPEALVSGRNSMAATIFFVLIISGTFHVVVASGAFNGMTMAIARRMRGREKLIIPILTVTFSLLCTTQGVNTLVAFAPVCVMLMRSVGYDAMVAVATIVLGGGLGFSCGTLNPQTTGIAHIITELPAYSGVGYRFFCQFALLIPTRRIPPRRHPAHQRTLRRRNPRPQTAHRQRKRRRPGP